MRYFIVYYQAKTEYGYSTGDCSVTCAGKNNFINREQISMQIMSGNPTFTAVVFTGFNEVSAAEHETWNLKADKKLEVGG